VLRRVEVPVLAPGSRPIRVLQISDLHLLPKQQHKIAWVRNLARLQPDLVIDTGDNWAASDALPALNDAVGELFQFPGIFVLGSNDYLTPLVRNPATYLKRPSLAERENRAELPWRALVNEFTAAGWQDADNRRGVVQLRDGREIEFVGTDDAHIDQDEFPAHGPQTNTQPVLKIGVTHAPYRRVLDAFVADGVDMIIAGHTHGGQICLPGFGALVTNCDLDRKRAKGLHGWPGARPDTAAGAREGSVWLHVSAGLGTSPYAPIRLACRPEATLLTLVARDARV